jgi:hypothetical protein
MKDYMKRAILGVLALPLLAAAPALADSRAECSNATLRGTYAVTTHGLRIGVYDTASPPAIHYLASPLRTDLIGVETFDGHGNATMAEYVFVNGSDLTHGFHGGAAGTYSVSRDCTGTEIVTFSDGTEIQRAFVLSNEGRTIHMLRTAQHLPALPPAALASGVTCSAPAGCDVAVQFYEDGERY